MNRVFLARVASFLLGGIVSACTPQPGSDGPRMPEPTVWRVPPPTYTEEERRRYDEVQAYLVEQYKDYKIVETTQTYIGDIVDWVEPASVEGSQVEPPPPISAAELELPPGVELQRTELEAHPELRGPAGTMAMVRPSFESYVRGWSGAASFEEFLQAQEGGRTDGANRLYAGWTTLIDNWGGGGQFSRFAGNVEENSFSLVELTISCDGPDKNNTLEQIGIVASQDRKNFGDAVLRLQVEFFSQGIKYGKNIGGWHGLSKGFIPFAGSASSPGSALEPVSTSGGPQYTSVFSIVYFFGGWWLSHNGNWLGYYPFELFDIINTNACDISWYGEVLDMTPSDWTFTDMGSGEFAEKGKSFAAQVSKMTYYEPTFATPKAPQSFGAMGPTDPKCYTKSDVFIDSVDGVNFYLGGPGGDALGCD